MPGAESVPGTAGPSPQPWQWDRELQSCPAVCAAGDTPVLPTPLWVTPGGPLGLDLQRLCEEIRVVCKCPNWSPLKVCALACDELHIKQSESRLGGWRVFLLSYIHSSCAPGTSEPWVEVHRPVKTVEFCSTDFSASRISPSCSDSDPFENDFLDWKRSNDLYVVNKE